MTGIIWRRLLGGIVTLALFLSALFFLVNVLIPGDWTSQFIMTRDARTDLQESLGIDRPLTEQFWTWISSVAVLDLGRSFGGEPVWTAVRQALATSLFVFFAATLIAFPLGYWIGRAVAWHQQPWLTIPSTAVAVLFFTAFPPAIAFLMQRGVTNLLSPHTLHTITELDADRWNVTPGDSRTPPQVLWRMLAIALVVGAVVLVLRRILAHSSSRRIPAGAVAIAIALGSVLGWRVSGFGAQAFDVASTMVILAAGLVLLSYGEILLVTEAAMLDTRAEDFILTARAKGLPERTVRDRHAARAALLPVLSRLVVSLPYFLTGLVILEFVFEVPGGLGNLIFGAISNQDTPLIVGAMAIVGVVTLLLRLALDLAIAALDPRIRLTSGAP